jgi:hypothetical protein
MDSKNLNATEASFSHVSFYETCVVAYQEIMIEEVDANK